jgi:hypothetical protein
MITAERWKKVEADLKPHAVRFFRGLGPSDAWRDAMQNVALAFAAADYEIKSDFGFAYIVLRRLRNRALEKYGRWKSLTKEPSVRCGIEEAAIAGDAIQKASLFLKPRYREIATNMVLLTQTRRDKKTINLVHRSRLAMRRALIRKAPGIQHLRTFSA